ncbi:MAG: YfiM family protein [Saprospiraceae bacterium]|nr:YfiM family protein [Saprospiraceae bacterium]
MDKLGHAFTSYFETELIYQGAMWAGMQRTSALLTAAGLAMIFQGTIEMLDAYSAEWGFSFYDLAFNVAGIGLFTTQQIIWDQQRIRLKVSSWSKRYPNDQIFSGNSEETTTIRTRTRELFGRSFPERFLKDYNRQTIWASFNLSSFLPRSEIPVWLNLALGYGANNMFGGFGNEWTQENAFFSLDKQHYDRYSQFYLAPDIDWTKIPSKSKFVRTFLTVLNLFKMPSPALEFNRKDTVKLHLLHF